MNVRIEKLESMRVASVRAVGEHPEPEAWEKLKAWAEPKGINDSLAPEADVFFDLYLPIEN